MSSYDHVERAWQNFQRLTFQAHAFAIHHHVDGARQFEINPLCRGAGSTMIEYVRTGEEAGQSPDQSEPPDRSPADVFDETVVGICVWRDHHVAAGEFAVVEGEKQGGVAVPFGCAGEAMRKRKMLERRKARKHAQNIAEFAPAS